MIYGLRVCVCVFLKSDFPPFLLLRHLAFVLCSWILKGRQRPMIWKWVLFGGFPEFGRNPGPRVGEARIYTLANLTPWSHPSGLVTARVLEPVLNINYSALHSPLSIISS